jgi:hypothetical protein
MNSIFIKKALKQFFGFATGGGRNFVWVETP